MTSVTTIPSLCPSLKPGDENSFASPGYTIIRLMPLDKTLKELFTTSDEQLMWRVKLAADAHAFATLMARWQRPIQNLCARMTGDLHQAQDLTQAAFARIYSHRADWEPTAKFSSFLWRVALNLCHDEFRRNERRGECSLEALQNENPVGLDLAASQEETPDVHADGSERAEWVRRALQQLAPPYREVVALRHYQGLKFHEIAEVLRIPTGTVKSRMAEALTQLNRLLKPLNEHSCSQNNQPRELLAL
jgi:RNA polymerase sigma-70 factor (ECF subfamily)